MSTGQNWSNSHRARVPVEAAIALSIVFLASEIVQHPRGRPSLTYQRPWLVAFLFGLLHGLGFAGALPEVGLPPSEISLALLFFNVGVEVGQLIFVFTALACAWLIRRLSQGAVQFRHIELVAAYVIVTLATYWLVERSSGIFWPVL